MIHYTNNKSIVVYFLACFVFWLSILSVLMISSLPETIITMRQLDKIRATAMVPEGWAFFTKNPREENIVLFNKQGDKWKLKTIRTGSSENLYGLNRNSRMGSQELGMILLNLGEPNWKNIKGKINDPANLLILDTMKAKEVVTISRYPLFSGVYVVQQAGLVPWAWYTSNPNIILDSKVCKIKVKSEWKH
jgi:antimicrobial peptide system SdpA family protein